MRTLARYLFDHIPKTAGMSMNAVFDDCVGPENVRRFLGWQHASQVIARWESKTILTGHFWHSPGSLVKRRRRYLTMLRRPEDRALSLYFFYRNNLPDSDDPAASLAQAMDLPEFLMSSNPAVVRAIHNFAVLHFRRLAEDGYSTTSDDARSLAAAKEVLEEYDFVGIHEDLAGSVERMCSRFGWPAVRSIPAVNPTRQRTSLSGIDPALRARLREVNRLDTELYEHALKLLEKGRRAAKRRFLDLGRFVGPTRAGTGDDEPARAPAPPAPTPSQFGAKVIEITGVEVKGALSGGPIVRSGEECVIVVEALAREASDDFTVGITIRDAFHQVIYATNSFHLGERLAVQPGKIYRVEFRMRMALGEGIHFVTAALHEGPGLYHHYFHWWEDAAHFVVRGRLGAPFQGTVDLSAVLARHEVPPLTEFAATLTSLEAPGRITAGSTFSLPVRIQNTGGQSWLSSCLRPVRVAYHWLDEAGNVVVYDGQRTALPGDLHAGDHAVVQVRVEAPPRPGNHTLRLTLVQETVAWFEDRGSVPLDFLVPIDAG